MFHSRRILLVWFASLVLTLSSFAQERKGTITGRVTDSSEAVLQGAEVTLEPAGVKVVSNGQGQFFIRDLEPGSYTLTINYVGFTTFTKKLDVVAGQVATVDVKLEVASQNQQVLVTAERASAEAEAVNRERTADNVLQVMPAEVIRSLPNANMADALGRLPSVTIERDEGEGKYVQIRGTEPRLTNVTVDGMNVPSPESGVRQIKLDAIPADIVESVEINKTLQANQDGDGIGGSVNLVTKTAGERPTVSISGMSGYTPIIGGRSLVETTGTVGKRFGSSKRFGLLVGGSYDWNGRGIDDIEPQADLVTLPNGSTALHDDAWRIADYKYYRTRWGLAGSADYTLGPGSNIYMRGIYSDFKNYGTNWFYNLTDNTPINTAAPGQPPNGIQLAGAAPGGNGGNGCTDNIQANCIGSPSFQVGSRRPDIEIGSVLLGGKHVLTTTWYSWDVSVGRSRETGSGYEPANFHSSPSLNACQFDAGKTTNPYLPQLTPACFQQAYASNPSNLSLSDFSSGHGITAQLNLQATGAMAKNYHIGSRLATIEIGGKFRNAHKFDDTYTIMTTTNAGVTVPMDKFPSRFSNSGYYGGHYPLGPNPNFEDVQAFGNANPSDFTSVSTAGVDPGNFSYVEKVSAGYVMNTFDFSGRIRLVGGVRFEGTNLSTLTFDSQTNTLSIKANGSYLKILPSASLRLALTNNTNLRLVYGRGLSRPDPQDIAQSVTFMFNGNPNSPNNTASFGNPNLKAETADDFDALLEHYMNPFGMISAGFFYKNLTDPIVTNTFILTNFKPTPVAPTGKYTVTQPINAGAAWVAGFEAAYLQHLTFLPGKLRGIGISANYGYTASQASGLPGRSDHPRLLRNAPNTWNISPTYDLGRISLRVGLSYNQANIQTYFFHDGTPTLDGTPSTATPGGLKGPLSDPYFYSHLQIDAQSSIRLSHGLNFVVYGLNLNNEVFGFYQGQPQFMIQREYYKPTIAAGFRWSPVHAK